METPGRWKAEAARLGVMAIVGCVWAVGKAVGKVLKVFDGTSISGGAWDGLGLVETLGGSEGQGGGPNEGQRRSGIE